MGFYSTSLHYSHLFRESKNAVWCKKWCKWCIAIFSFGFYSIAINPDSIFTNQGTNIYMSEYRFDFHFFHKKDTPLKGVPFIINITVFSYASTGTVLQEQLQIIL